MLAVETNEDVAGFHVAMDYVKIVHVRESLQDFGQEVAHVAQCQPKSHGVV